MDDDRRDANTAMDNENDDDTFAGYVPQSIDPGRWLFYGTVAVVVVLMYVVMPLMVFTTRKQQRKGRGLSAEMERKFNEIQSTVSVDAGPVIPNPSSLGDHYVAANGEMFEKPPDRYKATCWTIFRIDTESRQLLRYAIPYTIYSLANSVMENVCLALVGIYVGTKELAAYVLVILLTELTDQFLRGCIRANTTLCAHAIGANNNVLAGRYFQLSIVMYLLAGVPAAIFWSRHTEKVILWLAWGDDMVASYAAQFAKIYIWSLVVKSVQLAFKQILDLVNKEVFNSFMGFVEEAFNMVGLLIACEYGWEVTLPMVAWIYLVNAVVFMTLTILISICKGWLIPFRKGMFGWYAIFHGKAVCNMIRTCVPLSFGSLLNNSRWVALAVFASHLGEAEVAAWAVMGRLWRVSDSLAEGIGEAAASRVAYHLGNNHPSLAKLFAYKAMILGLFGAFISSATFYVYVDRIPALFTSDETLQSMMADALPYVGVGNAAFAFGYLCWFILGAQGKFKLGMWINFFASWGITIPLGFYFTWQLDWDIQGLSAALVMGYVAMGTCLAYSALISDWRTRAKKIYVRNSEHDAPDEELDNDTALATGGTDMLFSRNVKLLTAPPGPLHVRFDNVAHVPGCIVLEVMECSPLYGSLFPGDSVVGFNGHVIDDQPASYIRDIVRVCSSQGHILTVLSPCCRDEGTEKVLLTGKVPDIPDFEN